jgi:tetratricopeptide (TPR) repeat protein
MPMIREVQNSGGTHNVTESLQYWLAGLLFFIAALAAIGLFWQLINRQGRSLRGPKKAKTKTEDGRLRVNDQERLNRHEKQIVKRAKAHVRSGEIMAGATLFESIGMARDAIQVLEENGYIHDACKILLRMNRPNRAGVLFARNGMWDRAIDCFRIAGMTLEVAKCHRELRNYAQAAPLYAEVGRMKEAAYCYREAGQLEKSAEIFLEVDDIEAGIKILETLGNQGASLSRIQLSQKGIQGILKHCASGNLSKHLVGILIGKGLYSDLVFELQQNEKFDSLMTLIGFGNEIGFTQLIADQRFRDEFGVRTARLLSRAGQLNYAGILFERGYQFAEAAECFEKFGELERAAYCYQRSGDVGKVEGLRKALGIENRMQQKGELNAAGKKGQKQVVAAAKTLSESDPNAELTIRIDTGSGPVADGKTNASNHSPSLPERTDAKAQFDQIAPKKSIELQVGISKQPRQLSEDELNHFYVFSQTNFVNHLPEQIKLEIFKLGKLREYSDDELVLNSGEMPNGFYTVMSGAVRCYKAQGKDSEFVDMLNPSDSFGEVWLLSGYLAPMVFKSEGHIRLMFFPADDLFSYLQANGGVLRSIYLNFASRLIEQFVEVPILPPSGVKRTA